MRTPRGSGDYSFTMNTGTQQEWNACPSSCAKFDTCALTVYQDDVLVWGSPP